MGRFQVLLLLGSLSCVRTEVFDQNFLLRVEDMVKRIEKVTETNKQLNDTIFQREAKNAAINATLEDLKNSVEDLKTKNTGNDPCCNETISTMMAQIAALNSTVEALEAKNVKQDATNAALNASIEILVEKNLEQGVRNAALNATVEDLKTTVEVLKGENARLDAIIDELNITLSKITGLEIM